MPNVGLVTTDKKQPSLRQTITLQFPIAQCWETITARSGVNRAVCPEMLFDMGDGGHVPVTVPSFATENAPKCTVSRVKILLVAKSSPTGFNHKYHLAYV